MPCGMWAEISPYQPPLSVPRTVTTMWPRGIHTVVREERGEEEWKSKAMWKWFAQRYPIRTSHCLPASCSTAAPGYQAWPVTDFSTLLMDLALYYDSRTTLALPQCFGKKCWLLTRTSEQTRKRMWMDWWMETVELAVKPTTFDTQSKNGLTAWQKLSWNPCQVYKDETSPS